MSLCLLGVSQVRVEPVSGHILHKSGTAGNKLGTHVLAARAIQKKISGFVVPHFKVKAVAATFLWKRTGCC